MIIHVRFQQFSFLFFVFQFWKIFYNDKNIFQNPVSENTSVYPMSFFHLFFFFWKSIGEPMIILLLKLTYFMFMNKYHKIHIIFSFNIFLKLWNYIFPPLKWPMDSAQLKAAFKILPKSPPFKINKYFVVTCIFLFFSLLFKKIWCPFFTAIP